MWMKLHSFFCQLISTIVANANTSLGFTSQCSVLSGKLHMQALGFFIMMLDLSFSLLLVNVSLSNQFAKGFLQVGCFAELR